MHSQIIYLNVSIQFGVYFAWHNEIKCGRNEKQFFPIIADFFSSGARFVCIRVVRFVWFLQCIWIRLQLKKYKCHVNQRFFQMRWAQCWSTRWNSIQIRIFLPFMVSTILFSEKGGLPSLQIFTYLWKSLNKQESSRIDNVLTVRVSLRWKNRPKNAFGCRTTLQTASLRIYDAAYWIACSRIFNQTLTFELANINKSVPSLRLYSWCGGQ